MGIWSETLILKVINITDWTLQLDRKILFDPVMFRLKENWEAPLNCKSEEDDMITLREK